VVTAVAKLAHLEAVAVVCRHHFGFLGFISRCHFSES
jgi:hypothetical protein